MTTPFLDAPDLARLVSATAERASRSSRRLVEEFRPLFRSDPCEGVGLAALPILGTAGASASAEAPVRAALQGGRSGLAASGVLSLAPGRQVSGALPLVAGPLDATAVFARARDDTGRESVVVIDGDLVPTTETRRATGLREVGFRRAEVRDANVRAQWSVDPIADAHARAIVSGMWLGTVDTAIRMSVDYARARALYRGTVWDIPHARSLIARAHTWLLVSDTVIEHALDAPEDDGLAAAVDLVPLFLDAAMRALSVAFGSTFYARVEPYAEFETLVRDVSCSEILDPSGTGADRRRRPAVASPPSEEVLARFSQVAGPEVAAGLAAASRPSSGVVTRRALGAMSAAAACVPRGRAGDAGPLADAREAAALSVLAAFATGRRGAAPDDALEIIAAETGRCVDAGLTLTLDRTPVRVTD